MKILVTGGAGFIGSNFIRFMLSNYLNYRIVCLDKLTYAGNLQNLEDVARNSRYHFVKGDIADREAVEMIVSQGIDAIVNFAAETHVDRSIIGSADFIMTDVLGTYVLLDAVREHKISRFVQISTDEVYGSIETGSFTERSPLTPNNPYSASKAGGELQVLAAHRTFDLPVIITRASNNFGPYQYPEKVIPLFITNAIENKELPLYGDGLNVRDWLYVEDHCSAIDMVLHNGKIGEIYNIGGGNEVTNVDLTGKILDLMDKPKDLIKPVKDRLGHDRRYSIDSSKVKALGWMPEYNFESALSATVAWYQTHSLWWKPLKNGEYLEYYKQQYEERG